MQVAAAALPLCVTHHHQYQGAGDAGAGAYN